MNGDAGVHGAFGSRQSHCRCEVYNDAPKSVVLPPHLRMRYPRTYMGQPAEKQPRATYADLEALPAHMAGEIIGGELFVSPRPATRHALASSVLGGLLIRPFQLGLDGPGGWWIIDEVELHLGDDVLVPDVAGFRQARLPEYPDAAAM